MALVVFAVCLLATPLLVLFVASTKIVDWRVRRLARALPAGARLHRAWVDADGYWHDDDGALLVTCEWRHWDAAPSARVLRQAPCGPIEIDGVRVRDGVVGVRDASQRTVIHAAPGRRYIEIFSGERRAVAARLTRRLLSRRATVILVALTALSALMLGAFAALWRLPR